MAIIDLIRSSPLFFEMYDDEIEKVLRTQQVHTYTSGEKIIEFGQVGDQIFVLLEGVAELMKGNSKDDVKIETFKQGEVFGLLMLLDDKPYMIDVIAKTRCSVLEIKHRSIMDLFSKNPRIFAVMTLNICRILGKRLKHAHKKLSEFKAAAS